MLQKNFNEISNEWLNFKKLSVKTSTYEKYENIVINHLNVEFEKVNINFINEEKIINYFQKMRSNHHLSISTLKSIRFVLKAILEYAHIKYKSTNLNFTLIKLGKNQKGYTTLSIDQRKVLETYCFAHYNKSSLVTLLSLYGGFRVGEVAGLKWEDIDFDQAIIRVNRTIERLKTYNTYSTKTQLMILEPKSLSSKREVPIPNFIMDYIKQYFQIYSPISLTHYLYTNSNKIPDPRNIQYHFNKICKIHGFHMNYHSLRHTYATNCVMCGIDVKSLSEILGHSSVSITLDVYVHSTMEFKKNQICKLKKPDIVAD